MEELFEIIKPDGTPTGRLKARSLVHRDGDLHGAAHIWVYRIEGGRVELLLQKRKEDKDSFPGCYDTSSAGHLDPGESFLEGARRELKEELGIDAPAEELHYLYTNEIEAKAVFHGKPFHNHELIAVYLFLLPPDTEIVYQESEISDVLWMELTDLCEKAQDDAWAHCMDPEELVIIRKTFAQMKNLPC